MRRASLLGALAWLAIACRGDVGIVEQQIDDDNDGYNVDVDCDDAHRTVNPDAPELCDDLDNDCDGTVDESPADAPAWYADADGDGFGVAPGTASCEAPEGTVAVADDCDDTDETVHPDASEVCDGVDEDCDGVVDDDASDVIVWYVDGDTDGYGAGDAQASCALPAESSLTDDDCNDAQAGVNPGATEVCNARDDDCDGLVDGADPSLDDGSVSTWYFDGDGDGYGDDASATDDCDAPDDDWVTVGGDCNDAFVIMHPGANERCDPVDADEDCDGLSDDQDTNPTGRRSYYVDSDGDAYGVGSATLRCDPLTGEAPANGDCNDADAAVHPTAPEVCNLVDDDCDGTIDDPASLSCCTGTGLVWTIPDGCASDGGNTSLGDSVEVYCLADTARFCLSGEACPWRSGTPAVDDGTTCERSGLSSDYFASVSCQHWQGHALIHCDPGEHAYFP